MKVIERGTKRPKYYWLGRYLCAYCQSVIELTEEDAPAVTKAEEDQREGWSVTILCPVCDEERGLMDCDHVIGKCGGRGRKTA